VTALGDDAAMACAMARYRGEPVMMIAKSEGLHA
jgi:acetyl-CoA carboxylase alpha subunit